MHRFLSRASLLAIACLGLSANAFAQSPNGFGAIIHVPVVVNTASFQSSIFVFNPNASAANVQFNYTGAAITGTAGPVDCGLHAIPANSTTQFDLASLCPLNAGSNFGSLRVFETDSSNRPISVYTRVESPVAFNGFSVEGFPIGGFADDVGPSVAVGLRRNGGSPGYQTNCFVGSIGEPVKVDVSLYDSANTQIGTTQTLDIPAGGLTRMLDVFAAVGGTDGDYTNARAEFRQNSTQVGNPSFSAFCTVQNNSTFDADFRIAKTVTPDDQGQQYFSTTNKDGLGNNLVLPADSKQLFGMFVAHPDFLSCRVVGDNAGNAEIQIKNPQGVVAAGGDNIGDIPEFFTGEKSTVNGGTNGMWTVEVGSRDGTGLPTGTYVLQCRAGNGSSRPLLYATRPDDF